jgi:hypothetical protein
MRYEIKHGLIAEVRNNINTMFQELYGSVIDGTGDISARSIVLKGNAAILLENTTWDDLIQPLMGKNIDVSAGKLDYDWENKAIKFADSTLISNNAHKIHFGYQIEHRIKLDGKCHPHIHWIQSSSDVPNWWMRWRFWQNGKAAGSWTEAKYSSHLFTYSSGTIMQLTTFPEIDFSTATGGTLEVSDFLDIEFTRDTNNASGLFSGNDPLSGNASLRAFDPHIEVDTMGSCDEYSKTC